MTNLELLVPTSSKLGGTHLGPTRGLGLPLFITIAMVLHDAKSSALLVTSVTKFWHALIYSCKCEYLLWTLCILEKKVDEKWAHINHSQSHPMTNDKQVAFCNQCMYYGIYVSILFIGLIIYYD
jgi:hypothetical protein